MRVGNSQTFQITLSAEHVAVVLDGLSELPFKKVNGLVRYVQQQMQHQLEQAAAVNEQNEAAAKAAEEAEIAAIKREDPQLATAIAKAEQE